MKKASDKLPERQLRRLFPDAPESFIKANSDNYSDKAGSCKPKRMDWEEVCQTSGGEKVGKTYSLIACDIEFFAQHGHELDRDNKDNVRKCIWDALVNIGFERNDKKFEGKVNQRMDKTNINI